jgi:hypothetical protein
VEGLRLWRVTAMYDLPIASLGGLWPLLAVHFAGPSPCEFRSPRWMREMEEDRREAEPAAAAASDADVLQGGVVQHALAREALLMAAELVRHATR